MLSPDGTQLAVQVANGVVSRYVALVSAQGGPVNRFTFDEDSTDPVWAPDGLSIAFASRRDGPANLYLKTVGGEGQIDTLLIRNGSQYPHSFSPDGKHLAFYEATPTTGRDIWVLTVDGSEPPRALVQTQYNERMPSIAPNGSWFAYVSNQSESDEVYVERFPQGGSRIRVTTEGGRDPVWTENGNELVFSRPGEVWSAAVVYGPDSTIRFENHRLILSGLEDAVGQSDDGSRQVDVSSDGMRFFLTRGGGSQEQSQLMLVQNWFEELRQRTGN
jgi:Tol biopolymer transport system component